MPVGTTDAAAALTALEMCRSVLSKQAVELTEEQQTMLLSYSHDVEHYIEALRTDSTAQSTLRAVRKGVEAAEVLLLVLDKQSDRIQQLSDQVQQLSDEVQQLSNRLTSLESKFELLIDTGSQDVVDSSFLLVREVAAQVEMRVVLMCTSEPLHIASFITLKDLNLIPYSHDALQQLRQKYSKAFNSINLLRGLTLRTAYPQFRTNRGNICSIEEITVDDVQQAINVACAGSQFKEKAEAVLECLLDLRNDPNSSYKELFIKTYYNTGSTIEL